MIWLIKDLLPLISLKMLMCYVHGLKPEETVSSANPTPKIWECTVTDWDASVSFARTKMKQQESWLELKSTADSLGVILQSSVLKLLRGFYLIRLIKHNILRRSRLCLTGLFR